MHKLKSNYIKLTSETRLYNTLLPVIALTGGIATGKSSVAKILKDLGVPVIDADGLIKSIYKSQKTINFIKAVAPQVVHDDSIINFKLLREEFFNNSSLKVKIENFLYEKLPSEFTKALEKLDLSKFEFVVYDIPLLFEKKLQSKFDLSLLVYCPANIQISRLVKRDTIDEELAKNILSQQLDIESKKAMSDFVITNDKSPEALIEFVGKTLNSLTHQE
jgi:dephospho-CoA kinase